MVSDTLRNILFDGSAEEHKRTFEGQEESLQERWHPASESPKDTNARYLGFWESQSPEFIDFYRVMIWNGPLGWLSSERTTHKLTYWKKIRGPREEKTCK